MIKYIIVLVVSGFIGYGQAAVYEVGAGKTYATIQAGVDAAGSAGDTVLVYPGEYDEAVTINKVGAQGNPFVLKAVDHNNVIVSGLALLDGWTKCSSADDVGGNPNWNKIYYREMPKGVDRHGINLRQHDSLMTVCQTPAASDPFYDETTGEWWRVPQEAGAYTGAMITDPAHLTQSEDNYWKDAYVKIVSGNNTVYESKILGYFASTGRILFQAIGTSGIDSTKDRYCLSNHPILIQRPGDFYHDETESTLYVWPFDEANINNSIKYSARTQGLYMPGGTHMVIDGLNVLWFTGQTARMFKVTNTIIKNCTIAKGIDGVGIYGYELQNCVVESSFIGHCKDSRGIVFTSGGSHNTIRHCTFRKTGGTAVDYYGESNSDLLYNDLRDCNGQHANGLTCYLGGTNTLIKGNVIINCNVGLTYQEQDGMTIVNNVFDGGGAAWPVACWNPSNTSNITFIHNTSVGSGSNRSGFYRRELKSITNLVVKNNIIEGMEPQASADVDYNIYTMVALGQSFVPEANSQMLMRQEASIMVDYANYDYRLIDGSPAIDAGADLGITEDINGVTRPYGSAPDIGAYEWAGSAVKYHAGDIEGIPGVLAITPNPCPQGRSGRIVFSAPIGQTVTLADISGANVGELQKSYDGSSCFIPTNLMPGMYSIQAGGTQLGTLMIVE